MGLVGLGLKALNAESHCVFVVALGLGCTSCVVVVTNGNRVLGNTMGHLLKRKGGGGGLGLLPVFCIRGVFLLSLSFLSPFFL
jgi:hypothetical protein